MDLHTGHCKRSFENLVNPGWVGKNTYITLHLTFSDHALLSWRTTLLIKALRCFQDPPLGSLLGEKLHIETFQNCHMLLMDLLQLSPVYLQVKLSLVNGTVT